MAEAKVLKQIEFYFSDANFRRDKFMRGEAEKVCEMGVYIPVTG
jgi:hypothetical protein